MSILSKIMTAAACVGISFTHAQLGAAQDMGQNALGPNSFAIIDDVPVVQSTQEIIYDFIINGASVSEEACYAANETQAQSCSILELTKNQGSFNAVTIPKFAAPFQVQLVTTKAFKSDADWKRAYPDIPLWDLRHVCGGSLIAPNWVLTAAHCFKGVGAVPEKFGVRLDVGDLSDTSAQTIAIKDIILPAEYKDGAIGHDIALLRIDGAGTDPSAAQFNPLVDMEAGPKDIRQAYVLKSGKRFVTLSNDNKLKLWSTKTGKELKQYSGVQGESVLEANTDKLFFQTGNLITRIDLAKLRPDESYNHGNYISGFKLISDGKIMLVKGGGKHTFWNLKTGKKTAEIMDDTLREVQFVNANRYLARSSLSDYGLYDMTSGALITAIKSESLSQPLIMPDRKSLLIPHRQSLNLIDAQTGNVLTQITTVSGSSSLRVSSNGRYVIIANLFGKLDVWDLKDGREEAKPKDKSGESIRGASYAASANHIVFDTYKSLILWEINTGKILNQIEADRSGAPMPALFFNNEAHVAIPNKDGVTQVLEVKTGKILFTINHSVPITHVRLSADEHFILSYSNMGLAEVWDAKTGKAIERIFHGAPVAGLQLFKNDTSLLTWGYAQEARLWSVRKDQSSRSGGRAMPLQGAINSSSRRGENVASRVKPIKIAPGPVAEEPRGILMTYGWGKTRPVSGMAPSVLLRMMAFRKVPDKSCLFMISAPPERKKQLSDALEKDILFCAKDNARKTCTGDSGGPVISHDTLIGVVSKGGYNCGADGKPGIYTRVGAYADWINEEMRKPRPN